MAFEVGPVKRAAALFMYLSYKLETHYWFQVSLKNWLWAAIVGAPALALVRQISWPVAALASAIGASLLAGTGWARRRQYVIFYEEPATPGADRHLEPVQVDEQIRCRAFGLFAVGGKERYMVDQDALVSFVRTREHIVMAYVRRTRFLLLAASPKGDVGWWYVFVTPDRLHQVRLGTLCYGLRTEAALSVRYRPEQEPEAVQEFYLAFEDLEARQRVLDDLRRDLCRDPRRDPRR
jgi:hypothetical protein